MNSTRHARAVYGICLLVAVGAPFAANAAPVLVSADVSLSDPILGPAGPDLVIVGVNSPSIQSGDSTDIGSTVLLQGEYINVLPTSLIYHVEGGVLPFPDPLLGCPVAGYSCTGYGTGAAYNFTNLVFSEPDTYVEGVTVTLTDAEGISVGDGVSFTADSVSIDVGYGQLGIVSNTNGTTDFGTIEVDLELGTYSGTPPGGPSGGTPVPEPTLDGLFALGLVGLLAGRALRRRESRSSAD